MQHVSKIIVSIAFPAPSKCIMTRSEEINLIPTTLHVCLGGADLVVYVQPA